MGWAISPHPDESEREAILSALAAEAEERQSADPWADALLPSRDDDTAEHP